MCCNEKVFNDNSIDPQQAVYTAVREAAEFIEATVAEDWEGRSVGTDRGGATASWSSPVNGRVKFNVDGAWVNGRGEGNLRGAGVVAQNSSGRFVAAWSIHLGGAKSVSCVEA